MDDPARRRTGERIAGDPLHRLRAPEGAHVGKDLSGAGELVPEKHCDAVEEIVLRCADERFPYPVPVEGGVEQRLHEVAVGEVVRPLALALEAGGCRIVAHRFLLEPQLREARVSYHEVAADHRHLHHELPVRVLLRAGALRGGRVAVEALGAVLFHPVEGFRELDRIVDLLVHAAGELRHVHHLVAHAEP